VREHRNLDLWRRSVRLASEFVVLIVVLLAVLGGVVFVVVSATQKESIQRVLTNTSRVDSPRDAPAGVLVAISDAHGTQLSPNVPTGFPDAEAMQTVSSTGHEVQQTRTIGGHIYAMLTSADDGRVVQVAVDLRESSEELQRLSVAFIVSGIFAVVAAALIAVWMARRAIRPLSEALALQRRFVMDASHELRTPLTLLSTRAQLVRRRLSQGGTAALIDDVTHGLDEIVQDSRVLTEILEDLLVAADPREVAEKASFDLAALADEAISSLKPGADARGIALSRTGSSDPVIVTAARVSLQRLFTALIANALDHAASTVVVEVTSRGRESVIRVIDDGPGFPEGMDEHAFERFASARPTNQNDRAPRHYGLGLALVAEVAVRHHGGVSIESGPSGGGAAVVVRISTNA